MISLIEDMKGSHPGRVKLVLSNTPNAAGIAKAISKRIKTTVVDYQAFENNNLAFEKALNKELEKNEISQFTPDIEKIVSKKFQKLGFQSILLDPKGYRMGSLNEALEEKKGL